MKIPGRLVVGFSVIVLAIVFAENRVAITAWIAGQGNVFGIEQQSIKRDATLLNGQRLSTKGFLGQGLNNLGTTGEAMVQPRGYGIRVDSRNEKDGFYLVRHLKNWSVNSPNAPDGTFRLKIIGRVEQGAPKLRLACIKTVLEANVVSPDAEAGPNSTKFSRLEKAKGWKVTAKKHEFVDTKIGPANRFSWDKNKFLVYTSLSHLVEAAQKSTFRMTFWARAIHGSPKMAAFINRTGGNDGRTLIFQPSSQWKSYSLSHPGSWSGKGRLQFGFHSKDPQVPDAAVEIGKIELFKEAPSRNDKGRAETELPLPRFSRLEKDAGWHLTGNYEDVTTEIGPATRVSGGSGRFSAWKRLNWKVDADQRSPFRVTFWARAVQGSPTVVAYINRSGGLDGENLNFSPDSKWKRYFLYHSGLWRGKGSPQFGLSSSGKTSPDAAFEIGNFEILKLNYTSINPWGVSSGKEQKRIVHYADPIGLESGMREFIISGFEMVGLWVGGGKNSAYHLQSVKVQGVPSSAGTRKRLRCGDPVKSGTKSGKPGEKTRFPLRGK